jgi:hypothetical protein
LKALRHVIITRFSYRGREAFTSIAGPSFLRDQDPLDLERLNRRFRLFESTCLPSVLGQTEQDFRWVLIVDRDLPPTYRQRLLELVERRPGTSIHAFDPEQSLADLQWLGDQGAPGHVVTTNLDDDDCIPIDYVAALQRHLAALERRQSLPPIAIIGAKDAWEWDLAPAAGAPLGWRAPWHRGRWVMSVGFSLYCRWPEFNLCVLGLRHVLGESYVRFAEPVSHPNVRWFRREVLAAAEVHALDLTTWPPDALFHDISRDVGPVLLVNHDGNDQVTRLREYKAQRVAVSGPAEFPTFAIDWGKARAFLEREHPVST